MPSARSGRAASAKGILLTNTRDTEVSDNEIQSVRKEGVRDYYGLDNVIKDNRISLCTTGIEFGSAVGATAVNNYLHDNVNGFFPKHTSERPALAYWGLAEPRWTRIWHNTVYRSTNAAVAIAINAPAADYLDVRNNVFSGAGSTFIADAPWARGSHIVVDGNAYSSRGGRPVFAVPHRLRLHPRRLRRPGGAAGRARLGGSTAAGMRTPRPTPRRRRRRARPSPASTAPSCPTPTAARWERPGWLPRPRCGHPRP